ncbi:MAG: diguanylate cyclase [Eubacteriales bacterium]
MKILVVLNGENKIEKIIWNHEDLNLKIGEEIINIFPKESHKNLISNIRSCLVSEQASVVTSQLFLRDENIPITAFIMAVDGKNFFLIIDSKDLDYTTYNKFLKIHNEYTNLIRKEFKKTLKNKENESTEFLEEIQKLNNELINTRRQLQKANMKLNSKNKVLESRLVKDALTGLISRYQYWTEIEKLIENDRNKQGIFVFMDLDGFKSINDTYGHSTGDVFLTEFANRLKKVGIENSIKIRIAGDEFALYTHGYNEVDKETTDLIWNKIKEEITLEPIEINGVEIPVSISCGMAVYGRDTKDINELIEYGDFAMYKAKNKGKGTYEIFDLQEYKDYNSIETRKEELKRIIEEKDFTHIFQPIYSVLNREIIGYSAQLRVESKYFKNTDELISFAYEIGMYRQIDRASINNLNLDDKSCKGIQDKYLFLTHGPYPISNDFISDISFNCSEKIKIIFEMWMPINLEIKQMSRIKKEAVSRGIGISLANFGRKNSNDLLMLSCEPDFIRLNRDMINKSKKQKDVKKSIKNIIKYTKSQNTQIIGDFIESEKDLKLLEELGINLAQGFYFKK